MMLLIRTIEDNTSRATHGPGDLVVSESEVKAFHLRRKSGSEIVRRSTLPAVDEAGSTATLGASDFVIAMEKARRRLLGSLSKVGIFAALDDHQLTLLRDSMVRAAAH